MDAVGEAIVLAGGLGTRLRSVTGSLPKVMAPVGGRPFLGFVFDYLAREGIGKVVVATGYGRAVVQDHFGGQYRGMTLLWSEEEEPLGTGGAVRLALKYIEGERFFVLNGDTFFSVPLQTMAATCSVSTPAAIAVKKMNDFDRYGTVIIEKGLITRFMEKQKCREGYINGGVYLINKSWFMNNSPAGRFSLERDVFELRARHGELAAWPCEGYFIDIGVPEDYRRAQQELPSGSNGPAR